MSMFPKKSRKQRLFRKEPLLYGNIEHTFYGELLESPPVKPNVWSEIKSGEKCLRLKNYSYFVINTTVGVGHKGKRNEIDRVHIRYHLIPMKDNLHEPEVVSIYPNTISQTVGEITASQMIMRQLGIKAV